VEKPWAISGCQGRKPNIINTLHLTAEELEGRNRHLFSKYKEIQANEKRAETFMVEDADIVVVAFGLLARVIKRSVIDARKHGVKAGLIRPITLWPFPDEHIKSVADTCKVMLSMEISMGQMVQDIRLAVEGKVPVEFYGRIGFLPNPEELAQEIIAVAERKGL